MKILGILPQMGIRPFVSLSMGFAAFAALCLVAPALPGGGAHAAPDKSATLQRKHFGMLEPPFEVVEIRWPGVADTLGTGFASWCLTYESGRPTRIAFIGVTGD